MSLGLRDITIVSIVALVAAVLVIAGCGNGTTTTTTTAGDDGGSTTTDTVQTTITDGGGVPFKFAAAAPFTGQYKTYGASLKAGADIAVAELNAAGGVNGGQVSYVTADELGDPKEAFLVAQKLIKDPSVLFVDGHMFTGATLAAGPKYQEGGLPMISPSATNPDIAVLGDYIWCLCMTDRVQGEGLAAYAVTTMDRKKIAILHSDSSYGRDLADAFESAAQTAGGEVLAREYYVDGDNDFTTQLTKIRDTAPELLFLAGYYLEGSKIAVQAKELGMEVQMLGSDGYSSDELIRLGGTSVEGMLISTFFDYSKDDPITQRFVKSYKNNNHGANPDWFAAASYDVVMVAAQAAIEAGVNERNAINEALTGIVYSGLTGSLTFDDNGDVRKPLNIVVVQDGRLVTAPKQP